MTWTRSGVRAPVDPPIVFMKKKIIIPIILIISIIIGFVVFGLGTNNTKESALDNLESNISLGNVDLLVLVNEANKLPDDYDLDLVSVGEERVASVLVNDLIEMRDAAKSSGITLFIGSAYRSKSDQEQIYRDTISERIAQGMSEKVAKDLAAAPGYSEHQTGLAIDFSGGNNQQQMWDWLSGNSYKYGFILRYPEGGRCITGYNPEAWHYRYVGKKHAKEIFEQGLMLEEYLGVETRFCNIHR